MTPAFCRNIARPLHQARIACEHDDIISLRKIQEAIKTRWVNKQRQQQRSARSIAESINDIFEHSDPPSKLHEQYPDVFPAEDQELNQHQLSAGHLWIELLLMNDAPNITDPDVTVEDGDWRVMISKGGKMWVRLKTPAIVCRIQ
jgi:hypothetical protein